MRARVIENVVPLGATAEYTSGTRDMWLVAQDFGASMAFFRVEVDSDQSGEVEIDESTDLIIWEEAQTPTAYVGDTGILSISVQPTLRYARAKFTNDNVIQTRFTMTTGVDQS